jgi:tetratricopeptide (TPR) repeat protein
VTRRLRPALLLASLVALALACSSSEERLERHLERAQAYEDAGQVDKALIELQSALKLAPQNSSTNLRIAEVLERAEKYEEALFYFEEAVRLDASSDDAALGLARIIRLHDTDRADQLVSSVLDRSPSNPRAHVLRSDIHLVRSQFNEALASALTAAELDPKSPRVALQVAMARKAFIAERRAKKEPDDAQLFQEADAAFAKAIELGKEEPYWMVRAVIERARLLASWRGYGPDQIPVYKDAFAALADYPDLARRIAQAAAQHARSANDPEFLHWALSRVVETAPWTYEAWTELAELAERQGEDGEAIYARMVKELADDPQAQIMYADHLSGLGRHDEAVAHVEKFLPRSTQPAATLAALVQLHIAARDLPAAHATLERLRSEHPNTGPADQAEASLANAEGRLRDVLAVLERWTSREEDPTAFGLLADARVRAGNPRGALEAVDRAIALREQPRPDLHRLRGRILVQLGEHRSALQAFSRARTSGGPLPVAYLPDLATAYYSTGRKEEGRKTLDRALKAKVPPPGAFLLFARAEGQGDPKAAREALERGNTLYPNTLPFTIELTNLELREGKRDEALARVRAVATEFPDSPEAQKLLVQTLAAVGQKEEAAKLAEVVQERWPAYVGVAELYLGVMTRAGRGEEAFQALARKQEAGQLSPHGRVVLARLHQARGEEDKAVELLRSALSQVSDLPAAANNLAFLLAKRGEDLQEATELAQEARASRPDSSEIADTLGYVYMRRSLAEAALVQFDAALELAPAESGAWATAQFHRGLALRELGREEEAVLAVEQALASGAEFAESQDAHRVLAELAKAPSATAETKGGS